MAFKAQIISTFIGSIFGFIFGIFIFYITENIKRRTKKEETVRNFLDEIEFNVFIIDRWLKELEVRRNWLSRSKDSKNYYPLPKFSDRIQIFFINKIYEEGIIFEKVEKKDRPYLINFILLKNSNRENKINNMMVELVEIRRAPGISHNGRITSNLNLEFDLEISMLKGLKEVLTTTSDTIKSRSKIHIENLKNIFETTKHKLQSITKKN